MLQSLYIKNFALIDEIEINFTSGLNIIIGETGTGKSIIIDALMQTLGERSDSNLVKFGEQKTIIESTFFIENFFELTPFIEDDTIITNPNLILRREISTKGTSRAFINDTPVSISSLKEVGNYLLDFHGQHTHQQLLSPKFQLQLLDSIANNSKFLTRYKEIFYSLQQNIKYYRELLSNIEELRVKCEEFKQILKELERVNPRPNEIEEIESELQKMENYEAIHSVLNEIYDLSYSSENSIIEAFGKVAKQLRNLIKYDKSLENILEDLLTAQNIVDEVSKQIYSKINEIDFDPNRIEFLRNRLGELKYLEKKFIKYENIFQEKEKINQVFLELQSSEQFLNKIQEQILTAKQEIKEIANGIHIRRKESANYLELNLPVVLESLGMKNCRFKVEFSQTSLSDCSIDSLCIEENNKFIKLYDNGIDEIIFNIATNPSTRLLPLDTIASGGELSRIMLSLKSLVAEIYKFPTMIFDEIDVGISGNIARKAAILMKKIASSHQVIAITHLPQIAAAGDNIILISKKEDGKKVIVSARTLTAEERITEIAKLLSGEKITPSAIESAINLITEYQTK